MLSSSFSLRRGAVAPLCLGAALGLALWAPPAAASGTIDCQIDDKAVAFDAQIVFSHGLAGAFTNQRYELTLKAKGAPDDLRALELDAAALAHHWFHGAELKLHIYHERAAGRHGAVELVIETRQAGKADEEGAYAGRYRLDVSDLPDGARAAKTWTYRGKVACSAG
ncbi:hypothetical protein [Xanthobacter sp. KR7-225]|uniref:hypothetical protein n=1 Tax=Xanthobacter sp. KR7-225 TaxID=3156613 RepID=UPI0032B3891C